MIDLMILLGAFLVGATCSFLPLRAAAAARRLTGLCVQVPGAPAEHEDGRQ